MSLLDRILSEARERSVRDKLRELEKAYDSIVSVAGMGPHERLALASIQSEIRKLEKILRAK